MVPFLAATDIFFLRYHLRIRLSRRCCSERPGAVKGARLLGTAKRILDGEDRSETIAEEGKAGRKIGEKWSAKMVPSPTASNNRGARARARIKDRIVLRKSRGLRLGVQYPVSGSPKHGKFGLYLTEVLMSKNALAILLAALMVLPLQGAQQTSPTVQKQVGQIAKGSNIEVKMKPKKMNKVTGRLGEVTAEGFEGQRSEEHTS